MTNWLAGAFLCMCLNKEGCKSILEVKTNKLTTTSLVTHLAGVPDPRINRMY